MYTQSNIIFLFIAMIICFLTTDAYEEILEDKTTDYIGIEKQLKQLNFYSDKQEQEKAQQFPVQNPQQRYSNASRGSRQSAGNYIGSLQEGINSRIGRFLSLFTVVRFPNQGCIAASGDNGTCLTAAQCQQRGGSGNGVCANGFGICCIFMASCGRTIRENNTYFVNAGYPGQYDGTGSCQLTVVKMQPDVCQIRLDFDQFKILGPETLNNVCNNDQFIISGAGNPVPSICGMNMGNHMYIDAGMGQTQPITLTIVTSGPSFQRNWKIRVSQIPCNTNYKADDGCLQYFTGVSGQIRSFNYDPAGGLQLSNQDYSICIRMERNFCGIQYAQCPDTVNNRTQSFTLSGNTLQAIQAMVGTTGPTNFCPSDYIVIPCASNVGRQQAAGSPLCVDRMCGGTLGADISLIPATIMSTVKPFRIAFHTDSVEYPIDIGNRGFCLNYVQQPCTNILT